MVIEVVARDGTPLADDSGTPLPPIQTLQSQFVPPSGRIEWLVRAPPPGTRAYLITHAVDTGCAGDRVPERRLAVIEVPEAAASPERAGPASAPVSAPAPASAPAALQAAAWNRRSIAPTMFSGLIARHTDRKRVIALAEYPHPGTEDQIDFYLFERKPGAVLKPYAMGDSPAITVRAGTTEEWLVENSTLEIHAFHMHQVHFRDITVLSADPDDQPLLDTITVPAAPLIGDVDTGYPGAPGWVRLRMTFTTADIGEFVFHCHILEHEDNGMMERIQVVAD